MDGREKERASFTQSAFHLCPGEEGGRVEGTLWGGGLEAVLFLFFLPFFLSSLPHLVLR